MRVSDIKSMIQVVLISFPIVTVLSGCGLFAAREAAQKAQTVITSTQVIVRPELKIPSADKYIEKFALMALFANVVYRADLPAKNRSNESCTDKKPASVFGMPHSNTGEWQRWLSNNNYGKSCRDEKGLSYEVYIHVQCPQPPGPRQTCVASPEVVDEAVIAFRGTEVDTINSTWEDVKTNVSLAFTQNAPGYEDAREKIPALVKALKSTYGKVKIYATGHSLGGGLAQQAGYLSTDIEAVFAFNTSPMTDWPALVLNNMVRNPTPKIYRVFQQGEFLSFFRRAFEPFIETPIGRSDYEFNFTHSRTTSDHSIAVLSCNMARHIARSPTTCCQSASIAAHDFSREFALEILSPHYYAENQQTPLCQPGTFPDLIDAKFQE